MSFFYMPMATRLGTQESDMRVDCHLSNLDMKPAMANLDLKAVPVGISSTLGQEKESGKAQISVGLSADTPGPVYIGAAVDFDVLNSALTLELHGGGKVGLELNKTWGMTLAKGEGFVKSTSGNFVFGVRGVLLNAEVRYECKVKSKEGLHETPIGDRSTGTGRTGGTGSGGGRGGTRCL